MFNLKQRSGDQKFFWEINEPGIGELGVYPTRTQGEKTKAEKKKLRRQNGKTRSFTKLATLISGKMRFEEMQLVYTLVILHSLVAKLFMLYFLEYVLVDFSFCVSTHKS